MDIGFDELFGEHKKRECIECGRKLGIFEGYRHPTLGKDFLLCKECFNTVWESEVRWGRFVLWNSFNTESPDPTFSDSYPFPYPHSHKKKRMEKHEQDFFENNTTIETQNHTH